jgi:hypothetical protein
VKGLASVINADVEDMRANLTGTEGTTCHKCWVMLQPSAAGQLVKEVLAPHDYINSLSHVDAKALACVCDLIGASILQVNTCSCNTIKTAGLVTVRHAVQAWKL